MAGFYSISKPWRAFIPLLNHDGLVSCWRKSWKCRCGRMFKRIFPLKVLSLTSNLCQFDCFHIHFHDNAARKLPVSLVYPKLNTEQLVLVSDYAQRCFSFRLLSILYSCVFSASTFCCARSCSSLQAWARPLWASDRQNTDVGGSSVTVHIRSERCLTGSTAQASSGKGSMGKYSSPKEGSNKDIH